MDRRSSIEKEISVKYGSVVKALLRISNCFKRTRSLQSAPHLTSNSNTLKSSTTGFSTWRTPTTRMSPLLSCLHMTSYREAERKETSW